jgi:hypothetical protein
VILIVLASRSCFAICVSQGGYFNERSNHQLQQMRQQADADKDELYKQIGQLKVELDFLKKRAGLID